MIWTEQRIQALKVMWGRFSARDIARELGEGVSRSAVIGKAYRLKLSSAAGCGGQGGDCGSIRRTKGSSSSRTSKGYRDQGLERIGRGVPAGVHNIAEKGQVLRQMPKVTMPVMPSTQANVAREALRNIEAINRNIKGISVTEAGERHCRWPIGDPRSPDFRFCGCKVQEGLPYCPDHARVAYQSGSRSRQRMNEYDIIGDMRLSRAVGY